MMEMDNGTEQLIIELREGKECAFVKVFRTYYAPLLNYAGRILHDTELANDVVQEAFCGLFERRKELKGNMLLRPYLYKVVYNSCLDAIKHRKVESNYINQELLDFLNRKIMESIVRVEHLSHRYTVDWAIQDINFEVNRKGILGLLGSNGAGKSTTMNIICGVLNQTDGTVYINGIDTRKNSVEAKKNIGFLPQKPPLYPDHTVDEYLTFAAEMRLMDPKKIKQAVEIAKERCSIAHFSKRLIRNLSGGYQQRLGIAQAIVHNPKFVVLDEPTNGLDPNQILEIRKLIKEIAVDHAVLLSTHILSEVQAMCDDIKMIEHGHLVFSGTLEEFDNYVKPDTFIVKLDNPPADEDLLAIPGVVRLKHLDKNTLRVQFDKREDITEVVANACVHGGWGLCEITLERISLEEIFAQLSGKRLIDKF